VLLLSSCFHNQEAVNNAKKELGVLNDNNTQNKTVVEKKEATNNDSKKNLEKDSLIKEKTTKDETVKKQEKFIIKSLTMNNFIELDDLN